MYILYYNLDLFGEKFVEIRNNLRYTQKDLSELSGISIDALRKIENGKVSPTHTTLEILSPVLKTDLNQLLLEYRFDDFDQISIMINRINNKLESGKFDELTEEFLNIEIAMGNNKHNEYAHNMLQQMYLYLESILLNVRCKKYDICLSKLIQAMKITNPDFILKNYDCFIYSVMEIRILMNIALVSFHVKSEKFSYEALKFCLDSLEPTENNLRIKLLYNLSNCCYKLDFHKESLHYANLGIEACILNKSLSCLELLYSRKAIAEFYLEDQNYKSTLRYAMTLYDISHKYRLKKMFINSCKRIHGIDINNILSNFLNPQNLSSEKS